MADNARRSPLAGWTNELQALGSAIHVQELPFLTQLNLRLDPSGPAADPVAKVLGVAIPTIPCTSVRSGLYEVLWLGPDEWLILAPPGSEAELGTALREAIGPEHGAVTDVSAQRTAVQLSGPGARELLAKGCSIDLHPRVNPVGSCVQTLLAQTGIIIVARDHTATDFLLLVRSSFAEYFAAWLVDASIELTGSA
ncbi:MAG TPA: sarcosine oxidase subunit gamma family protein [Jatrophihabitans sp.]